VTDAAIEAHGPALLAEMKYGGRWWQCGGLLSSPSIGDTRERFYLLTRGSECARVEAMQVEAVREARKSR
jgi:hypothetical protein